MGKTVDIPQPGQIARVRQRTYLVEQIVKPKRAADSTLVKLSCVDDDNQGALAVLQRSTSKTTNKRWRITSQAHPPAHPHSLTSGVATSMNWYCARAVLEITTSTGTSNTRSSPQRHPLAPSQSATPTPPTANWRFSMRQELQSPVPQSTIDTPTLVENGTTHSLSTTTALECTIHSQVDSVREIFSAILMVTTFTRHTGT